MALSSQTVTWVMLLKMVSSRYHNLLSFRSRKGCFHMFSLGTTICFDKPLDETIPILTFFSCGESIQSQVITSTKCHENVFEVAASRVCVLHRPTTTKPITVISIEKAVVALRYQFTLQKVLLQQSIQKHPKNLKCLFCQNPLTKLIDK